MRNCSDDERILDLFTKVSHHRDVPCIYLTQNLFPPGTFSRSISLRITSSHLTTHAIPWDFREHWRSRHLQEEFLTYGKAFKMLRQNPLGISSWIYILAHQTFNDYEPIYYSHRVLTETEKSVLARGLRFCLPPENVDKYEVKSSFELLFRDLKRHGPTLTVENEERLKCQF